MKEDGAMSSLNSERYFRIVRISSDGTETIQKACLEEESAVGYVDTHNKLSHRLGSRLEARELDIWSARLKSNPNGQFE